MNEQDSINKELKTNRILLIVLIAIVLFFFASFGFICYKTYSFAMSFKPAFEALSHVDFEKIEEMTEQLDSLKDLDVDGIMEALESVDFESLKTIDMEQIEKLVGSVDVDELENAMEALKEAAETLQRVADKINPILSFFN